MNRSLFCSVAAVAAAAALAVSGRAATVTVTLDIYYGDSNGDNFPDAAAAGSWQLVARTSSGDNRGIAGLDTALTGVVNSVGPDGATFRAPTGAAIVGGAPGEAGFQTLFDAKSWAQDQDASVFTFDALFGQVPRDTPNQGLFYDVGQTDNPSIKASNDVANGQPPITGLESVVTWNFDDPLGDYLADNDQDNDNGHFQRGVLLAQGRFNAGSAPAIADGSTAANVFTALGTQTTRPPNGTIHAATIVPQTRNNLFAFMGDANLDGVVDAARDDGRGDGNILLANIGRTGDVLWQEGDFNGDKDCDIVQPDGMGDAQIFTAALGSGIVVEASALVAAGTAAAIYNAATGELAIDIGAGVGVIGFVTQGLFDPVLNPVASLPGIAVQHTNDVLGLFAGGNPLPEGLLSLGNVLPIGLSASQVQAAFTPVGAATADAAVAVVPEPASAALFAVAMAMVARGPACRRRS